jgi:hypothetical protein
MSRAACRMPAGFVCAAALMVVNLAASPAARAVGPTALIERMDVDYSIDGLGARIGSDLLIVGPVSISDAAGQTAEILGQSIVVPPQSSGILHDVAVGEVLAVAGHVTSSGAILARRVVRVPTSYIDGASEVLVTGVVTELTTSLARAKVGGLIIDYSPALYSGETGIAKGSVIRLRGIRPAESGPLVAFAAKVLPAVSRGSGIAGSMGSGIAGSMGSGIAGSMGSGIAGSMGSGITGSMGSGITGSMGSGIAGSMGSGITGSMGSGIAGSMGSGIAGSMGSGITGSMGSGIAGSDSLGLP